jgi:2-pyrone-4,6-dicarboxylate lactonase
MGRPDVAKGVDHPDFQRFMDLMRNNDKVWTKVSCPERLTNTPPDYSDVVPYMRALVEAFPDRVLWGTDWPHPNMKSHTPDDGMLVDVIPHIAVTEELQRKLLIDNPMRLYWER